MNKVIEIELSGWIYQIPIQIIASNRAKYYAEIDSRIEDDDPCDPDIYKQTYDAEFNYTYKDDIEARDWTRNNINWGDVVGCAKRVRAIGYPTFLDQWNQKMAIGDFNIVELP